MKDRVVLLSGGLDSAVLLATWDAAASIALHVVYEHPAQAYELRAARGIAAYLGVPLNVVPARMQAQALRRGVGEPGARVVPGRNAVLISVAVNVAGAMGCDKVAIGATAADCDGYPDCRPGFVSSISELMFSAYGVSVHAPLIGHSRAQVSEMAKGARVHPSQVWSCYQPTDDGKQCGACNSCKQIAVMA